MELIIRPVSRSKNFSTENSRMRHAHPSTELTPVPKEAKRLERIHPSVLEADYEELIAAGWGNYERHTIPEDWRTRRPLYEPGY